MLRATLDGEFPRITLAPIGTMANSAPEDLGESAINHHYYLTDLFEREDSQRLALEISNGGRYGRV